MSDGLEHQLRRIADALEGRAPARYTDPAPSAKFRERFPNATVDTRIGGFTVDDMARRLAAKDSRSFEAAVILERLRQDQEVLHRICRTLSCWDGTDAGLVEYLRAATAGVHFSPTVRRGERIRDVTRMGEVWEIRDQGVYIGRTVEVMSSGRHEAYSLAADGLIVCPDHPSGHWSTMAEAEAVIRHAWAEKPGGADAD